MQAAAANNNEIPHFAPVTPAQYARAVAHLLNAVQRHPGTSGSRAAAGVLLSAHNAYSFQLDITDLCLLDEENLDAALTVIQGRATLRIEPHEVIVDGERHLQALWKRYRFLSLEERAKRGD